MNDYFITLVKQNKTKWNVPLDIAGKSIISVHAETTKFFIILGNKQMNVGLASAKEVCKRILKLALKICLFPKIVNTLF